MARGIHRLSAPQVRAAKTPGLLHDGGGLYLQIAAKLELDGQPVGVTKSWLFRFTAPSGKRREMGLGAAEAVSLADARTAAEAAKRLARSGVDPIAHRRAERAAAVVEAARAMTFRQAAEAYVKAERASWRSEKYAKLWIATLETYAYPALGALSVAAVGVTDVLKALEPIWRIKHETARRVRQRIESILDWAAVRGYRQGDNPARWRGHLERALPSRAKVRPVRHHPALPFAQVGAFVADLHKLDGLGALALELTILTAVRSAETLGARWAEFDLDGAGGDGPLWTLPAERMKSSRPHRVPLSRQAVALLRELRKFGSRAWVFPGLGTKRPLSGMAMLKTLERMGRYTITVHGFRSTFRDWAGESTGFPREVAEAALAHSLGDKTESAYARGDLFAKRRKLMQAWADYCDRPAAAVVVAIGEAKRARKGEHE